ncbi:MAG: nucleotidyltransferase domain-containing protein [Chloroflexota bacterium]|nr:nucleotidyltransferase domain-containing protein [Chloroflexota bacterium]
MEAIDAARALIERDFPDCLAAFLAGSVVRGEATATSDLDIMVIRGPEQETFRESLRDFGWPIEVFVHTEETHRRFAASDAARRRPATSRMVCEGIILVDQDGLATQLKQDACALLAQGPPPLDEDRIAMARYSLTDLLDDLIGCQDETEGRFIAQLLAEQSADLIVDIHGQWRGQGKWLPRALGVVDPSLPVELSDALREYYCQGDCTALITFAKKTLDLAGGPLWDGFRLTSN